MDIRWSTGSRLNLKLQASAASCIHLSARRAPEHNARLAQESLNVICPGFIGPQTLRIWTCWIMKSGELCWRNTTISDQSQKRWELKVALKLIWQDLAYLWNPSTRPSKTLQRDSEHVWYWWWTHWTQVLKQYQVCLITIIWDVT